MAVLSGSLNFNFGLGGGASIDKPPVLATTFNFRVTLNGSGGNPPALGEIGFQECTGLDVEMDVQELIEGGRNDGVVRLAGRGKYSNIVLKRGMVIADGGKVNSQLWGWMQNTLTGIKPVARYDGVIQVYSPDRTQVVATWTFDRGLPAKIAGPQLNAKTGEIAIEELTIAHEGLRLRI